MEVSPALTEISPPEVPLTRSTSGSRRSGSPVTVDAHDEDMAPVQAEDVNEVGVQMTEDQTKFYVASQCQRWQEVSAGRIVPPGIRYDWPFGKPDSQAYYSATLQTSRYLEQRMSVASQAVSDGQTSKSAVMVDDYPEDQDGDSVMTTQEVQLLGQVFARQVTASGLRRSRSPHSSVGEPEPKRPQHQPPRPNMSSIPSASTFQSYPSSDATTRGVKREVPSANSARSSSGFSSGIFRATGGSDESLPSATSGSRVSRDSVSGSSGWSFGIGVGTHMPFAGVMPRVMTAQETGGTVPIGGYV
ncbi:hypothetical protein PHMEG_00037840 [Phytophthora megakarya]|uniref:Uncharacterized protein n=1 Tax=Phytophthora megakarya TaxID=4795 RepID=A0A225UJ33_9STRA|nr:hypothetical protein PHMEG_00037840 [Phytophthora megakarya]